MARAGALLTVAAIGLAACSSGEAVSNASQPNGVVGYTPIGAISDCADLAAETERFSAKAAAFYAVGDLANARLAEYFAAAAARRGSYLNCGLGLVP